MKMKTDINIELSDFWFDQMAFLDLASNYH